MKYEIDESNHQYWLNKGPWYNKSICSRLHVSLFEESITHARTDRYNILCYLVAHYKKQPDYEHEESSIGYRLILKHVTTEALEALGSTINIIETWLKILNHNYDVIFGMYNKAVKDMSKQIPITMTKPLSKKKAQKLMTEIGGGWYMEIF